MYETNAGITAMTGSMKPNNPVAKTKNIVKGTNGNTRIFTGKAINDTSPDKYIMSGKVNNCVDRAEDTSSKIQYGMRSFLAVGARKFSIGLLYKIKPSVAAKLI